MRQKGDKKNTSRPTRVSPEWSRTAALIKQIQHHEVGITQEDLYAKLCERGYQHEYTTFQAILRARREPNGANVFFCLLAGIFAERWPKSVERPHKEKEYLDLFYETYTGRKSGDGNDLKLESVESASKIARQIEELNTKLNEIQTFVRFFAFKSGLLEIDGRFGWAPNGVEELRSPDDLVELGRRFLFGDNDQFSAAPGLGKPFYPTQKIHPGARAQLDSITSRLRLDDNVRTVESLNASRPVGDWISLSGPINNLFARNLLGTGGPSPLFCLVAPLRKATPPVRFDISKHLARGPGETLRRDWELVVQDGEAEKRFGDGEYLLVTSIPDPYQPSGRTVNLASMFPPGAMAIDLLLQDWRLMERILKATKDYAGWQALIPVGIANDQPIRLEEPTIFQLSIDFEKLRDVVIKRNLFGSSTDKRLPKKTTP